MPTRRLLLLLASLAATGAVAAPARANGVQLSVMMDDDNLVYRSTRTADRTLDTMAQLGVDYVRVTVLWKVVADRAQTGRAAKRRFRRYGADDPRAYPAGNWDRYDNLVRSAGARGIGVYFNLTGPGPDWCCPTPPRGEERNVGTWMPNPRQFKLFVEAVGRRYSGRYRDENSRAKRARDKILPRVSFWSLWNEPNQGGWLTPQWWRGRAYSPMLYRNLYIKGREGLFATGHGNDTILLGETAPIGKNERRSRAPMYPLTFVKTLFCVDGQGNRRPGIGCDAFTRYGPLLATAYAHHPYTKDRSPLSRYPNPAAITMANLGTLTSLLDAIAAKTARIQQQIPIALTEFGYETRPPDPYNGVSPARQAEYNTLAELLAWANPRVISQTQFLLRDVAPLKGYPRTSRRRWFTYQSGLFYNNGRPKPAAAAYAFPFVAQPVARNAEGRIVYALWGQLRFRPNRLRDPVYFQFRPAGSRSWVALGDPVLTSTRNYFTGSATPPGPGLLRAVWGGNARPYIAVSPTQPVG